MPGKDLVIRIFGEDVNASKALKKVGTEGQATAKHLNTFANAGITALAGFAAYSVKSAADFQTSMTALKTGAGESQTNMGLVSAGLLKMAVDTGTTTQQLQAGMYMVESAGKHGAEGLAVLRAAAEGAKVGSADLGTVANALTSALNAYHLPASAAATVTSQLVATVAAGKMHMEDLAVALANVLPVAAAAKISFAQVGGAIATMTAQGMSADQASQNLANAIRSLQSPSAVAVKEMSQLGVQAVDIQQHVGSRGLTGTIQLLSDAIFKHMGPGGLVLQSAFNKSKYAAQDAQAMLSKLPPSLQKLGHEFLNNGITQKQWTAALKGQDVLTANLGKQFAMTAKHAHGFSDILRSGSPAAQTYTAAMGKMMGGATGLNVALMIGGANMSTFVANTKSIAGAATEAGGHVKGWSEVQKDFNFKLAKLKEIVQTVAISLGTQLLPPLSAVADFIGRNIGVISKLLIGLVALAVLIKTITLAMKAFQLIMVVIRTVTMAWSAAQFALNVLLIANPIGLVIVAIAALVAIIVLVGLKFGWFKIAINAVWTAIKATFEWIKGHWQLLLGILMGPIGLFILGIKKFWPQISAVFSGAITALTTVWNTLKDILLAPFNLFKTLLGPIVSGIMLVLGPILNGISAVVGFLTGHGGTSPAKTAAGKSLAASNAHGLGAMHATGGIITRPIFSSAGIFGESGPEAVIPLSAGRGFAGLGGIGGAGGAPTVVRLVLDGKTLAEGVVSSFGAEKSRGRSHALAVKLA